MQIERIIPWTHAATFTVENIAREIDVGLYRLVYSGGAPLFVSQIDMVKKIKEREPLFYALTVEFKDGHYQSILSVLITE